MERRPLALDDRARLFRVAEQRTASSRRRDRLLHHADAPAHLALLAARSAPFPARYRPRRRNPGPSPSRRPQLPAAPAARRRAPLPPPSMPSPPPRPPCLPSSTSLPAPHTVRLSPIPHPLLSRLVPDHSPRLPFMVGGCGLKPPRDPNPSKQGLRRTATRNNGRTGKRTGRNRLGSLRARGAAPAARSPSSTSSRHPRPPPPQPAAGRRVTRTRWVRSPPPSTSWRSPGAPPTAPATSAAPSTKPAKSAHHPGVRQR